jgi:DNA polymerase I-like protein with 3'-5' exonuclease and polymerase domains
MVGEIEPEKIPLEIRLVNSEKDYIYLRDKLLDEERLHLDLEWDPEGKILLAGIQAPDGPVWVFPIWHPESNLPAYDVEHWLRCLVNVPITVVGHNLKSDLGVLLKGAPVLCLADDSMMWHYMLDEHKASRKLRTLAREFTPYEKIEDVDATDIANTPLREAARYNAVDVALPPLIIKGIKKDLDRYGCYSPQMVEFNKRLIPFIATMSSAGMAVDSGRVREVYKNQSARLEELGEEMGQLAPQVKNLDSHQQLSAYLFGTKGGFSEQKLGEMGITDPLSLDVPDVKDNWGTRYARTAKHVIDLLPDSSAEFVTKLKEHRSLGKEIRTYAANILRNLVDDCMVYPDIYPATIDEGGGTTSGRLSSRNPPAQTLDEDMAITSAFVSRYGLKGVLMGVDGGQMELRWGADESQDPYLCDAFRRKVDLHADTARIANKDRDEGKTANFASIYGCSLRKLIELGITPSVARILKKTLEKNWARLYEFEREIAWGILETGETRTPYGRVRRVPGAKSLWSHEVLQGVNFRFQAPASDLCHLLGWLIMVTGEGILIPTMTNHDGIIFDLEEKNCAKALDIVGGCVVQWSYLVREVLGVELTIPYVFDVEVGPNLQQLKEITSFECRNN